MRQELGKLGNAQRFRFSGKFVRFGAKRRWEEARQEKDWKISRPTKVIVQ